MTSQLRRLNRERQEYLREEAQEILRDWDEPGNVEIVWNGHQHEAQCTNEDETILVLYRCECGELIVGQEEVGEDAECECGRLLID